MFKRIPIFTLIIIVILAMSITLMDFGDLSWNNNEKSYLGLIVGFTALFIKLIYKIK